jgi:uncharacterized delta-60 repeat protein
MTMRTRSTALAVLAIALPVVLVLGSTAAAVLRTGTGGRPGSLDPALAGRGFLIRDFGSQPGRAGVRKVLAAPDGGTLVLSDHDSVARFGPDGELDTSFAEGGFLALGADQAEAIAVGSDGDLLVAGFESAAASAPLEVTRYRPDGTVDPSFGDRGATVLATPEPLLEGPPAMFVEPSGRLVLFGRVSTGGVTGIEAARIDPDGGVDRTYGNRGYAFVETSAGDVSGPLRAYAFDAGELTVAVRDESGDLLIRLGSDGRPDPSFGRSGEIRSTFPDGANSLALEPDGGLLVGGEGDRLVRLGPDGSVDANFGEGGIAQLPPLENLRVAAVTVAADGTILVAGDTRGAPSFDPEVFDLVRLTPEGRIDPSFGGGQGFVAERLLAAASEEVTDLVPLPEGRLLLAGTLTPAGLPFPFEIGLARFDGDGTLDPGFGSAGAVVQRPDVQSLDSAASVAAGTAGGVTVAGSAAGQALVARYRADGSLDPGFGSAGVVSPGAGGLGATSLAAVPDGVLVGTASAAGGGVLRLGPGGRPDGGFGQDGFAPTPAIDAVLAIAPTKGGDVVVAGYSREPCEVLVARLRPDGSIDSSLGGGTGYASTGTISGVCAPPRLSLAVRPSGRILLGGSILSGFLIELATDGVRAPRFRLAAKGDRSRSRLPEKVEAIALDRRGRILVTGRTRDQMQVTRLTPRGLEDRAFGGDGTVEPAAGRFAEGTGLAVGGDGSIYVSGFLGECKSRCRTSRAAVFGLEADGRPDREFGRHGVWSRRFGTSSRLLAIALDRGSILAAGLANRPATSRDLLVLRLRR